MFLLTLTSLLLQGVEYAITIIETLFTALLTTIDNRILLIRDYSNEKPVYIMPLLRLNYCDTVVSIKRLEEESNFKLADVIFVKGGHVHKMICKEETLQAVKLQVRKVKKEDIDAAKRDIMKNIVFFEIGKKNISRYIYSTGWSLNDKILVKDVKKLHSITTDETLDITYDKDFSVEEKKDDESVLDQVDFMKRS